MDLRFLLKVSLKVNPFKSIYYSIRFGGKVMVGWGGRIFVGKHSRIKFTSRKSSLYLGVHFNISEAAVLDLHDNSLLEVGKSVGIHKGSKVVVRKGGILKIGDNSFINERCRIQCANFISIGKNTSIGWGCNILDTDLHAIFVNGEIVNKDVRVDIGSKVWICAGCSVMKGSKIDDNVVVGMSSLVSNSRLFSNYVYGGNPAVKIKKFDTWGSF